MVNISKIAFINLFLFVICSSEIKAQFIRVESNLKDFKNESAVTFNVSLMAGENNPLTYILKIDNPAQDSLKTYLRKRNDYNFLEEKRITKEAKSLMTLNFSMLDEGEYTFVVRTANNFFIKHFQVESGDLGTNRVKGKDVMNVNRVITFIDN